MRRVILLLLLALLSVVVILQFGQISKFLVAVENGQPLWIGVAFLVQAVWQVLQVWQFQSTHNLAGSAQRWRAIFPVATANNFVVVAAPSGSVSTFALFIADARRRSVQTPAVILGVALFAVAEYLAISLLILAALYLQADRGLFALVLTPGLVIFGFTGLFAGTIGLGLYSPGRLTPWLIQVSRPINWVARKMGRAEPISAATLNLFVSTITDEFIILRKQPLLEWLRPVLVAVLAKIGMVVLFGIVCLAFDQSLSGVALVTSVTVALAYTVVSPTPLGIGVAEGAIIYTLTRLGVPNEQAILISLTYRGFTLWLPMVYGFIVLEWAGLRSAVSFKSG